MKKQNSQHEELRAKPRIRTQYNPPIYKGQHNSQPSLTVPDQSLTVVQILKQHTKGITFPNGKMELWEGDEELMPDLVGLDLSEIQDLREMAAQRIADIRERYIKQQDVNKRKKLLTELRSEIEAQQKETQIDNKSNPASDAGNSKAPTR